MLLLAVLPVAFWPDSTAYESAKFLVLAIAMGVVLLAGSARVMASEPFVRPGPGPTFVWLGILTVLICGGWFGAEMSWVARGVTLFAAWSTVLWLAYATVRTQQHTRGLLAAITLGAVLPALYGLAQIRGWAPGPAKGGVLPGISTFGNENQMAGLAALAIWPAAALVVMAKLRYARMGAAAGLVVLLVALQQASATGPRVAAAAAGAIVIVASVLLWSGRRGRVPGAIQLMIMIGAVAVGLIFSGVLEPSLFSRWPLPDRASDVLAANHGDIRRTDWLVAWYLFKHNFLGCGIGNYQLLWPEARAALDNLPGGAELARSVPRATRAHNEYLQALAELGLPGGLCLTAVGGCLLAGIKRKWRALTDRRSAQAWLLLLGGVLTAAIHSLVSFPLHLPAPSLVVAALLGVLCGPSLGREEFGSGTWRVPRRLAPVPLLLGIAVLVLGAREFQGDRYAARGERLYRVQRVPAALAELESANRLMIWPGIGQVYEGLALSALGQSREAHRVLLASLKRVPTYEASLALAELETDQGEYETALARLDLVAACQPTGHFVLEALYLRGMVHLRRNEFGEARRRFDELLAIAPLNPRGLLASGYLSALEGKPGEARGFYQRALRRAERELAENENPEMTLRLTLIKDTARRALASTD